MRLRNRPWAAGELAACPYYVADGSELQGKWGAAFPNRAPIWLELGCGKGLYLAAEAWRHREINFIGADIKGLMLAYARRAIQASYDAAGMPVDNLKLLYLDAARISLAFSAADVVDRILINFPNPWPKPRHFKRRLVHPRQLLLYREFLADGGDILFKTDSDLLYRAAQQDFSQAGFEIAEDLADYYSVHPLREESLTEHERKFLSEGLPIHFIRAVKLPGGGRIVQ